MLSARSTHYNVRKTRLLPFLVPYAIVLAKSHSWAQEQKDVKSASYPGIQQVVIDFLASNWLVLLFLALFVIIAYIRIKHHLRRNFFFHWRHLKVSMFVEFIFGVLMLSSLLGWLSGTQIITLFNVFAGIATVAGVFLTLIYIRDLSDPIYSLEQLLHYILDDLGAINERNSVRAISEEEQRKQIYYITTVPTLNPVCSLT